MLKDDQLKEILLKTKTLSEKEFGLSVQEAQNRNQSLETYLISQKVMNEQQIYQTAASFYTLPFIDLKNTTVRKDVLFLIPEPIATTHKIVAFDRTDSELRVAALDPQDLQIFEFLRKKTGLEVKIHIATPEGLNEVLKNYHKGLKAEFKDLTTEEEAAGKPGEPGHDDKLKELAQDLPVIRIVDTLLEYAILESASDIHIEPGEKDVIVRYRIDGILKNVMTLPKSVHPGVIARIKILSNLKLDEHRLPQDGRFKIEADTYNVSFRVSIIPAYDGEKVVLRLLNEKTGLLTLEQLGFQPRVLEIIKRDMVKPHGLFLVTGPTGSGKTTTLYAILNVLNKPEVNITTIEDPIEYRMPGINQSQVNPKIGYTFAIGLRAYLRQDPDIIMVGEIRDGETANIAIGAALTGHFVFSTLHTNDAAGTFPRLADLGVDPKSFGSAVTISMAQRLVRKLDPAKKKERPLTAAEKKMIERVFESLADKTLIPQKIETVWEPEGADDTGYKGRIGLYEAIFMDDELAHFLRDNPPENEIAKITAKQGYLTMAQDGILKALAGITSLSEVASAVDLPH